MDTPPQTQPTEAPTAPSAPAENKNTGTTTATPQQGTTTSTPTSGLSKGAKIGLGICGGCLALLILGGIATLVTGGLLLKSAPSFIKSGLEKQGINIDEHTGNVKIEDKQTGNTVEYGDSLELPTNFPSDIPTYSGATIQYKYSANKDGNVVFLTDDIYTKVNTYYKTEMVKKGWTTKDTFEMNEAVQTSYTKGNWEVAVLAAKNTDTSDGSKNTTFTITYTYEEPTE